MAAQRDETITEHGDSGNQPVVEETEDEEREREKEKEKPQDQESPTGTGSVKSSKKGRRSALSRVERAKIRILDQHGVPRPVIASLLSRSYQTIATLLFKKHKMGLRDDDNDYDHVDDAFIAKFPPPPTTHEEETRVSPRRSIKRSNSSENIAVSRAMRLPTPASSQRLTRSKKNLRTVSSHPRRTPKPGQPKHQSNFPQGGRRSEPIDLVSDDGEEPIDNPTTPVPITLAGFLSCLAHDISWIQQDLEKQDLGSMEKLLAIADWSEDDLHMMFREALPDITVPQRFILVKGLKRRYEELLGHDAGVLW